MLSQNVPAWLSREKTYSNMAATEEVDYYKLYKSQPVYFHFYVAPFILLYAVWLYIWFMVYGVSEYFEIGAITGVMILLIQILMWLFSMWSVHVRCFLTCRKVSCDYVYAWVTYSFAGIVVKNGNLHGNFHVVVINKFFGRMRVDTAPGNTLQNCTLSQSTHKIPRITVIELEL